MRMPSTRCCQAGVRQRIAAAEQPFNDLDIHQLLRQRTGRMLTEADLFAPAVHDDTRRIVRHQRPPRGQVRNIERVDGGDPLRRGKLQQAQSGAEIVFRDEFGVERHDAALPDVLAQFVESVLAVDELLRHGGVIVLVHQHWAAGNGGSTVRPTHPALERKIRTS